MGCDGSKRCEHFRIDDSCIVKEGAGDFLYKLFVFWYQERGVIHIGGVLLFPPVAGLDVGVRLILRFLLMFEVETFDGIHNIFEHGEVDDAVSVVSIKIKT